MKDTGLIHSTSCASTRLSDPHPLSELLLVLSHAFPEFSTHVTSSHPFSEAYLLVFKIDTFSGDICCGESCATVLPVSYPLAPHILHSPDTR